MTERALTVSFEKGDLCELEIIERKKVLLLFDTKGHGKYSDCWTITSCYNVSLTINSICRGRFSLLVMQDLFEKKRPRSEYLPFSLSGKSTNSLHSTFTYHKNYILDFISRMKKKSIVNIHNEGHFCQ